MTIKKEGFLIFDIESSDLYNIKYVAYNKNQAWIVQFGGIIVNNKLDVVDTLSFILKPPFKEATISQSAFEAHGITLERCITKGIPQYKLYDVLRPVFDGKLRLVGHNLNFDAKFLHRFPKTQKERSNLIEAHHNGICTMRSSINYCKFPPTKAMKIAQKKGLKKWKNWKPSKYKTPTLTELHQKLFKTDFVGAHDALNDANATLKCFKKLVKLGVIVL